MLDKHLKPNQNYINFSQTHIFNLDKLLDELNVNTLKEVQDKHQQDHSLDFAIANYVYPEKWHIIQADMISNPNIMYTKGVHPNRIFYPKLIFSSKHLETSQESKMCWCRWKMVWLYNKMSLQTPSQCIRTKTDYTEKNSSSTQLLRQTTLTDARYLHSYCHSY